MASPVVFCMAYRANQQKTGKHRAMFVQLQSIYMCLAFENMALRTGYTMSSNLLCDYAVSHCIQYVSC